MKLTRMPKGFRLFNITEWQKSLKKYKQKQLKQQVLIKPEIADDIINDHNNIEDMLIVNYMLKTLKLVILILNVSYFLGNGWFIICDLSQRAILSYRESHPENGGES